MNTMRRSLLLLVIVGAGLVAIVGTVGTLAAFSTARAVDHLVEDLTPAAESNSRVYTDVLSAGAAVRAYAISGDEDELADYRASVARIESSSTALKEYARDFLGVAMLYNAQDAAIDAWIKGYAEPRIAHGGGPGTYQPALYRTGSKLFRDVTSAHEELATVIREQYDDVRADTNRKINATVSMIAASALIGILIMAVLAWWVLTSMARPLAALERTVTQLAAGDHDARARVQGPREISRVAAALNQLSDENERARGLEMQVHRQLREMDTAKTDFVSNVSHELRTPLTIISGYLELLDEDSEELSAEQTNMLHVAQRNVMRLRELIEDLLMLNRAEQSGTTLELIELNEVVKEVVSDMNFAAANRDLAIEYTQPHQPIIILGDASQLHRAILNLVSNALKFSPRGQQVEVTLSTEGAEATVSVVDHGMGIPEDDLDKLGARFFRASNAVRREISGTGLGLRIVQTIVMNHHGSLALSSVEDQGTTAVVTLPVVVGEQGARVDG